MSETTLPHYYSSFPVCARAVKQHLFLWCK